MLMPYSIGDQKFSTQKRITAYIRDMLKTYSNNPEGISKSYYPFLSALIQRHPDYETYLQPLEIYKFASKPEQFNKGHNLICIGKHGTEIPSWRKMVSGKPPTDLAIMRSVLRIEIYPQIEAYRNNNRVCVVCGSLRDLQVDHCGEFEFKDISNMWMNLPPFEEIEIEECNIPIFGGLHIVDRTIAEDWRNYHKTHAKLQSLCVDCHNKKTYKK